MNQRTPTDGDFELLPTAEPGYWQFRVARADAVMGPDSGIAAGTTYANCTGMSVRPRLDTWGTYVAAQVEPAGPGHVWQYFVRALPSIPAVTEGPFDPVWGRTYVHSYVDLVANSRPERGDDFSISSTTLERTLSTGVLRTLTSGATRTLSGTRPVLDVQENDLGNGLCAVKVVTVNAARVQKNAQVVDTETGLLKVTAKIHYLGPTAPVGFGVRADRYFAEVTPVEHHHWLAAVDKASTLPSSEAEANVYSTTGKIYWPAVLEWYRFWKVFTPDGVPYDDLFSYSMRDPYAGDVKVDVREWFQTTPYTVPRPAEMMGSSIRIDGLNNSISIPEALHARLFYEEKTYVPYDEGVYTKYIVFVNSWEFGATAHTDWPETVARVQQKFERGGYRIKKETYHRPDLSTVPTNNVRAYSYTYTDYFNQN